MKIKILIILVVFLTLLNGVTANVQVQYSEDNATNWQNVTHTYESDKEADQTFLHSNTVYYFRARNGTSTWTYLSQRTLATTEDYMIFFTVAIIFLFITTLVVIGLIRTELLWLRVVLSLTLSFMLMTILRLAAWFVEINEPTETVLIHTLNFYYSIGVRGFYFLLAGTMIFLVIYIINSIRERPSKIRKDDWINWGKDDNW